MEKFYKRWKVTVKEVGNDTILTPEVWGDKTEEDVIEQLGLRNQDVEWYRIEDLDAKKSDKKFEP